MLTGSLGSFWQRATLVDLQLRDQLNWLEHLDDPKENMNVGLIAHRHTGNFHFMAGISSLCGTLEWFYVGSENVASLCQRSTSLFNIANADDHYALFLDGALDSDNGYWHVSWESVFIEKKMKFWCGKHFEIIVKVVGKEALSEITCH